MAFILILLLGGTLAAGASMLDIGEVETDEEDIEGDQDYTDYLDEIDWISPDELWGNSDTSDEEQPAEDTQTQAVEPEPIPGLPETVQITELPQNLDATAQAETVDTTDQDDEDEDDQDDGIPVVPVNLNTPDIGQDMAAADNHVGTEGNDTIYGGAHEDIINGNGGDDRLSGSWFVSLDDFHSDIIDGGAGNDTIEFGNFDTVTGGEGDDVFISTGNMAEHAVITDFNPEEDLIVVRYANFDIPTLEEQLVQDDRVVLSFDDGVRIFVEGVTEPIDESLIRILKNGQSYD